MAEIKSAFPQKPSTSAVSTAAAMAKSRNCRSRMAAHACKWPFRDLTQSIAHSQLRLSQIFQNLIGNAIKYRREETPRDRIGATRGGFGWKVALQDNQIGIRREYQESIFGLFKRLHSTGKHSGSGIGLAICQRIVQRDGGRIWIESEPGRGSTFFFTVKGRQARAAHRHCGR